MVAWRYDHFLVLLVMPWDVFYITSKDEGSFGTFDFLQNTNLIQIFPSRHSSDKVAKLESQVESYKKKLEDLGDLRRQVKLLEEKNTAYMQNTVSLEEELRKANAARSQLETYKRQVRKSSSTQRFSAFLNTSLS